MDRAYGRGPDLGFPGRGHIVLITAPSPAAGADWTLTPPPGAVWRILGGSAQFVSSSAAATRQVLIEVTVGGVLVIPLIAGSSQAASLTYTYAMLPGIPNGTLVSTYPVVAFPVDLILDNRWRLQSSTASIQTGDQWSAIVFAVEELVPAPPE